jgi:hypothetical protein
MLMINYNCYNKDIITYIVNIWWNESETRINYRNGTNQDWRWVHVDIRNKWIKSLLGSKVEPLGTNKRLAASELK